MNQMPRKLKHILAKSLSLSLTRPGSTVITTNQRGYTPKMGDEMEFVALHTVERHDDRIGNSDDHFQADAPQELADWFIG
jgi:hypothetical protein